MEDMKKNEAKKMFESWIEGAIEFTGETFELHDDSRYAELVRHVLDHKYLANQKLSRELSMREAVYSWYEEVYEPVVRALDQNGITREFPELTRTELFLQATQHWHFLKQHKDWRTSPGKAVLDYGARFAASPFSRLVYRLREQVA